MWTLLRDIDAESYKIVLVTMPRLLEYFSWIWADPLSGGVFVHELMVKGESAICNVIVEWHDTCAYFVKRQPAKYYLLYSIY